MHPVCCMHVYALPLDVCTGTEAHHQHSKGDPAYCAATATGKNEGPATGEARGQDFGAAAPQPAAAATAGTHNKVPTKHNMLNAMAVPRSYLQQVTAHTVHKKAIVKSAMQATYSLLCAPWVDNSRAIFLCCCLLLFVCVCMQDLRHSCSSRMLLVRLVRC
jgi:hypothetical protein